MASHIKVPFKISVNGRLLKVCLYCNRYLDSTGHPTSKIWSGKALVSHKICSDSSCHAKIMIDLGP